jgi:DNA-binding transcriptional LysR family regulator
LISFQANKFDNDYRLCRWKNAMELRQLQTFREVAKTLSFTRTAATLNYAQSSVSAQIQALEEELGVTLFDRLGRRITLTAAGQRLLPYADKMLALADEALIAVPDDQEPTGSLAIAAPETLCAYRLPPVVEAFRHCHPKVDIIFRPSPTGEDWDTLLADGLADAALLMTEPYQSERLLVEPLYPEPILVLVNSRHRLSHGQLLAPQEFQGETLLLTEAGCPYRLILERLLRRANVTPANILEFHSVEAIKQCALTGMGIAVLPWVVVQHEVAAERLVPLTVDGLTFNLITQLAWHKDKWISPALAAFLAMTRTMLGQKELAMVAVA